MNLRIFRSLIASVFSLFIFWNANAQDTSHLRISLLTCSPGAELYSIFGHSAIRVVDSSSVTDYVYNYGTFNFDDEGFYLKFIQGKLLYYVSLQEFKGTYGFKADYEFQGRGITEQVLNLSPTEKIATQAFLNNNLKTENRYYKYDFFLDNCTTRLRDIILALRQPSPQLPAVMPVQTTFRNAIHQYLDAGHQHWSKLGIDILMGRPTDAIMTTAQQQFLPDNLMLALDKADVKVVESKATVIPNQQQIESSAWSTPRFIFSAVVALFLLLSFSNNERLRLLLAGLDGLLFFMTGVLGFIIVFMMTGTDHSMTKDNFNLLWAWPTHLFVSFFIRRQNRFLGLYFGLTSIAMILLLISWFFLPQQMNDALLLIVFLILFRSVMRWRAIKDRHER